MLYSYIKNSFVPTPKVSLDVCSDMTGTIRGYRIFTACRTVNHSYIFHVNDHIDRLFDSAKQIFMELPHTKQELQKVLEQVVKKNKNREGELLLEILYTGGPASANSIVPAGKAELIVLVFELKTPPLFWYEKGVTLATFPYQRMLPTVKYPSYIPAMMAHQTVVKKFNAQEALCIDPEDGITILEGTTFNVFIVDKKRRILTPPSDGHILPGVTRAVVMDICKKSKLKIQEQCITLNDVINASEMFLTSSTRNIVPVIKIDHLLVGDGVPGTTTNFLRKKLREYQNAYTS